MSGATLPAGSDPLGGPAAGAPPGARDPDIRSEARAILEANWRDPGFCVPNATTYPWQWLWDSCFHAVCWAHLGEADRAVTELTHALAREAADGFVPHMTYWHDGSTHADFWGRTGTSAITQPPMYGHALAELHRLGVALPDTLVDRADRGLRFLLTERMRAGVGPVIVHPWESGCDDSARWDPWCPAPWTFDRWKVVKGELVAALVEGSGSTPVGSSAFEVASAGFGALVAFNARELGVVTGDASLRADADAIVAQLADRWRAEHRTWADAVVVGPDSGATTRTLDALLPVLVSGDADAVAVAAAEVVDDAAFGGAFGPAATHRDEPTFDPHAYWRGPAWPQLTYLLWVAAGRRGEDALATDLAGRLVAGAERSGFAEYWDPDTGRGLGAIPQSGAALAAVV